MIEWMMMVMMVMRAIASSEQEKKEEMRSCVVVMVTMMMLMSDIGGEMDVSGRLRDYGSWGKMESGGLQFGLCSRIRQSRPTANKLLE